MVQSEPSRRPVILVVEDEALILFSIADDLREAGFEVLEALNADAAITLLESRSDISVLFTDIDMPGSMDGLKLSAAVRDRWPPVKIIVTSGHVKLTRDALPLGGRFFAKPYDSSALVATIRELTAA
jgi:two-component system, response regulator PdtaR